MKKNILYICMACLAMGGLTACSDDPLDATEKHVYGENDNPYLRTDADATISCSAEFREGRISPITIDLKDYAATIQSKLGMTVDDLMSAVDNGRVVFYNINSTKARWDKTAPTVGSTGWGYTSNGALCEADKVAEAAATISLDKASKALIVSVPEESVAGLSITENLGFAIVNGKNYDDYVRFRISIAITNPGLIITSLSIPAGDYNATAIDFTTADNRKVIEDNLGVSADEFISQCDDPEGDFAMYMVDNTTGEWDTTSDYTANGIGYWLDANGKVTTWGTTGYTVFVENASADKCVNIGRAPEIAAGTELDLNFVYVLKSDPENKYFQIKAKVTME